MTYVQDSPNIRGTNILSIYYLDPVKQTEGPPPTPYFNDNNLLCGTKLNTLDMLRSKQCVL